MQIAAKHRQGIRSVNAEIILIPFNSLSGLMRLVVNAVLRLNHVLAHLLLEHLLLEHLLPGN